jgi:hypothetical protein
MKKIILLIMALVWLSSLIVLILALTNLLENNPFENYKLLIGIGFLAITGIFRAIYNKIIKIE